MPAARQSDPSAEERSEAPRLRTARLELIAATPSIAACDARERRRLGALLCAEVPEDWPPPLLDEHLEQFATMLAEGGPALVGWWGWYLVRTAPEGTRLLIGNAGVGDPGQSGESSVGYGILPQHWGRGYASEALAALLQWAADSGRVRRFVGHTYPHLVASVRVLEKSGFLYAGAGAEPGTIRFERPASPGS